MNNLQDILHTIPLSVLLVTGLLLMLLDAFKVRSALAWVAGGGMLLAAVLALPPVLREIVGSETGELNPVSFSGMLRTGPMDSIIFIFLVASGFFTVFFISDFLKRQDKPIYESYSLVVFAVIGMVLLANANDLIIAFIGLETMSICLYVMAASFKKDVKSNEAGLKYFLLGAFASGFFLYGIALIYGGAGTTNYTVLISKPEAAVNLVSSGLIYPAMGLMLVGFLFKVAAFPFHAWTPDVYTGTPTPLAGFMATGSKAAAFIAFGYFMGVSGAAADEKINYVIQVVALATMIYGNVVAVQQRNLKRMLAYSSIAHSGYLLLAIASGSDFGFTALIFYVFIYTLMNIGAFAMISMVENQDQDQEVENWKGLGITHPWFGAALSIFLFSLAGVPPLAGFFAKYFVFISAIEAKLVILATLGILTSVIGAYYYIRVVVNLFFVKGENPKVSLACESAPVVGVALLAALVIALGAYPGLVQSGWFDGAGAAMTAMVNP